MNISTSDYYYRVATLFKTYLTITGIIIPTLKFNMPKSTIRYIRYGRTDGPKM